MVSVEHALKTILMSVKPLTNEKVHINNALNRILAEDIFSTLNVPYLDNSAMDGYAVRSRDTYGISDRRPDTLKVVSDVRAGYLANRGIRKNQAIRIMTGAPVPKGADSVLMVEYTEKIKTDKEELVKIFSSVKPGANVRRAGEDIKKGERVISKGTRLTSARIGLLASIGKSAVKVTRKPKIAILSTGDEVIEVTDKLKPGKVYNSNTYTLYNQILECGGIPNDLGIAKDNPYDLTRKIKKGLDSDVIVISGGVSVGDYDFVKDVLLKLGTKIKFWKIAMRPGKPIVFGIIKGIPVFGLPGNPVSSMVSFNSFVKPAMLKMLNVKKGVTGKVRARLEETIKTKKGLRYFLRAETVWKGNGFITRTTGAQGSGILKSMALANSLIIIPEKVQKINKGAMVDIKFIN